MNLEAEPIEAEEIGELPPEAAPIDPGPPEVGTLEPEPEPLPDDLAAMLAGVGSEATNLDLWRRDPSTRRQGFLENIRRDDFSMDLIAERWGGGEYEIRPKRADGRYLANTFRTFDVAGASKDPRAAAVDARAVDPQLATLTQLVLEMAAELRARRDEPAGEGSMSLALEMAKAITKAGSDAAARAREMFEGQGQQDPFDLLDKVMALQERLNPGGGGGGDDVVKQLGRELLTVFRENRGGGGHQPSGAAATRGAAPNPSAPDPTRPAWVNLIGQYVPQLMALAAGGKEPAVYSVVLQDQLQDLAPAALDQLAYVVSGPEFADTFYRHFPDALPYRQWFDELIAALRSDLLEEYDDGGDSEADTTAGEVPEAEKGSGASEPDNG